MIAAWVPNKDKHAIFGDKIPNIKFATSLQEVSDLLRSDRAEALFIDYLDVDINEFCLLTRLPFVFRSMLIITAQGCEILTIAKQLGFITRFIH